MTCIRTLLALGFAILIPRFAQAHGGPGVEVFFIAPAVYLVPYILGLLASGKGNRLAFARYALAMFVANFVLLYVSWTPGEFSRAFVICGLPWVLVPFAARLRGQQHGSVTSMRTKAKDIDGRP